MPAQICVLCLFYLLPIKHRNCRHPHILPCSRLLIFHFSATVPRMVRLWVPVTVLFLVSDLAVAQARKGLTENPFFQYNTEEKPLRHNETEIKERFGPRVGLWNGIQGSQHLRVKVMFQCYNLDHLYASATGLRHLCSGKH